MKVECPYCKETYNVKRSQLGKEAKCAMCHSSFILYVEGVSPIVPRKKNYDKKKVLIIAICAVALCLVGGGVVFAMTSDSGLSALKFWEKSKKKGKKKDKNKDKEEQPGGGIAKAKWLNSQNNLKQISLGLATYAYDNNEKLPASLNDLITSKTLMDPKVYIALFDDVSKPATDKLTDENTTYAYLGEGEVTGRPTIIAFEKPWLLPDGWNEIHILLADGILSTEKIEGVSKMTCRQLVETLTKDYSDRKTAESLIKKAEQIDNSRKTE